MHPFEAAIDFLLKHVVRHGDGVAAPAAQRHLEAIAELAVENDEEPEAPAAAPEPPAAPALAGIVDALVGVLKADGPSLSQSEPKAIAPDQAPAK